MIERSHLVQSLYLPLAAVDQPREVLPGGSCAGWRRPVRGAAADAAWRLRLALRLGGRTPRSGQRSSTAVLRRHHWRQLRPSTSSGRAGAHPRLAPIPRSVTPDLIRGPARFRRLRVTATSGPPGQARGDGRQRRGNPDARGRTRAGTLTPPPRSAPSPAPAAARGSGR